MRILRQVVGYSLHDHRSMVGQELRSTNVLEMMKLYRVSVWSIFTGWIIGASLILNNKPKG